MISPDSVKKSSLANVKRKEKVKKPKPHPPPPYHVFTPAMRPSRSINLLRDAVLALVKVGSSASSRSNASQISSRVGTDLNDGSAARRGGTDQVESALCD